jgi:hypothetical protein
MDSTGVEIITGILTEEECIKHIDGFWGIFEHLSKDWAVPIDREKPPSWREFDKLFPSHGMLYQHWGVGHSQPAWDVRQHPKVLAVFESIWDCKTDDLLVSFDGISFMPPPEETNRGWYRNKDWLHTDQSYTKKGMNTIQGSVNLFDTKEEDATFCYLEGSHLLHEEFGKHFGILDKDDFIMVKEEEQMKFYLERGCIKKRVACPRGSIVLWDSRTVHCGVGPLKSRESPQFRAIVYVCYKPRAFCTDKILKKRVEIFEKSRMSTHDPCKAKMFGKLPRTYGKQLPIESVLPPPIVTERMKRLVGY